MSNVVDLSDRFKAKSSGNKTSEIAANIRKLIEEAQDD
jgi:hypothetical protein